MNTVRRMRWWDLPAVCELERSLFPQPWTAETFLSELAHVPDTRHYLVAVPGECGLDPIGTDAGHIHGEQVSGYAGLRAVGAEADVQTIAVAPGARGTGLGGRLLDALLAEALRRGCREVFLEVRPDNTAATALYASRGFERIALRRGYYAPGEDAVIMRLRSRVAAP